MADFDGPDLDGRDLDAEQAYVSMLYDRLDRMRAQAAERLAEVLRAPGGTPQARSQRDSESGRYTEQLAGLNAVENGLCFGRLDFRDDPAPFYIGRVGIFDEDGDYDPLLVDWRAPAARPFYLATAASPDGVARRRHIRTVGRVVSGLDDEVLDLGAARSARRTRYEGLTGEAALLAALDAARTGRMKDIVETIQGEQDRIIRSGLSGVLVVQGGPGTGKTAVALHRAAYLLYTHRQQLSSRGVLIVGPNATFLRYISQVLPSLAETGVLLCTPGELYPGVVARRTEPAEVAAFKGRTAMVDVLTAAVRDRQRLPDGPVEIHCGEDIGVLVLDPTTVERARGRARRSGKLHNQARELFAIEIVHALAGQLGDRIGFDPYAHDPLGGGDAPGVENVLDEADLAEIRRELHAQPAVLAAIDGLWPILTPGQLLTDLYGSDERLAAAGVDAPGRALLRRDAAHPTHGGGWSPADVPLLDEAMELLGEDEAGIAVAAAAAERHRQAMLDYAEGALDILTGSRSIDVEDEDDPELLLATDLLDPTRLDERQEDRELLTTAQRAAADRTWAFGHVIVDEAQELSPMAWRLLMRRCPSRSMTVVGDVAQTGDLAGTASWGDVLEPYVADRWRLATLTVNYRTPAEIMEVAGKVLARVAAGSPSGAGLSGAGLSGAGLEPPRSVRETGVPPWRLAADPADLPAVVAATVVRETALVGDGRLAVIAPAAQVDALAKAVVDVAPDAAVGDTPELESRVVVLTVRQAKGLEFDGVVVVDPAAIVGESPRGWGDLYVALTRPTQRLGVVHPEPIPVELSGLVPLDPEPVRR